MNAKNTIVEVLSHLKSPQSSPSPYARHNGVFNKHRYPLNHFSFIKCQRLRKQFIAHGINFDGKLEMSKLCRIDQIIQNGQSQTLTLISPIYIKASGARKSSVAFQVKIPSTQLEAGQASGNSSPLHVDQFIWIDPSTLSDFKYPCPEFMMGSMYVANVQVADVEVAHVEVVSGPLNEHQTSNQTGDQSINPFDYASPLNMDKWVYAPGCTQAISTQELTNILALLFELMIPSDQNLLRAMLLTQNRLNRFISAPASTCTHHHYKHGLLEHTVEVCLQALLLIDEGKAPSEVDLSQLILQSILHDFGKLDEYEQMGHGVYTLSNSGLLLGHQIKVALWAHQAALEMGSYCGERLTQLIHGLTAVNRDCAQSGNRSRKTVESLIANHADRLSAASNAQSKGSWLLNNQFCVEV
jgi:23S rRNA maturation-related 3'-5' exoribonuclease YhaM